MDVNLQDQRYRLKTLKVTIDGTDVDIAHIIDLTIDFNMYNPYISANLCLKAPKDSLEKYKYEGNAKIQITAKDSQETEYDNTFVAYTSSAEKVTPEEVVIFFKMIDEFSFKASRLYVSKGFEKASISDILDSDKMLKPLYDEFNTKKRNFENIDFKLDTFAVPSSKSALSVQNYIKEYFNVLVYQTRTEYKIQKWETLMDREMLKHSGKDVIFKYPSPNPSYIFTIDDFRAKQADTLDSSTYAPDLQIYSYDPKNRSKKFFSYDVKKTVKDIGSDIEVPKIAEGIKYAYQSMVNPENQIKTQYQRNIYGSSSCEFICKGNFIINPGDLVILDYEGNEKQASSKTLAGKYIVVRVTDKIVQGYFSQRIVIARPNVEESKEAESVANTELESLSVAEPSFQESISQVGNTVTNTVSGVTDSVSNITSGLTSVVSNATGTIGSTLDQATGDIQQVGNTITNTVSSVTAPLGQVGNAINGVASSITNGISGTMNNIGSIATGGLSSLGNIGNTLNPSSIKNAIKNAAVSELKGVVGSALSNLPLKDLPISASSLSNVAQNVIQGGINGNLNLKQAFSPVIGEVAGTVFSTVKGIAGDSISSVVSKVTDNLPIGQGLINNLSSALTQKAGNTVTSLGTALINSGGDADIQGILRSSVNSVKQSASGTIFNEVSNVVRSSADTILTPISDSAINQTRNNIKFYENIVPEKNSTIRTSISPLVNQVKNTAMSVALDKLKDSLKF